MANKKHGMRKKKIRIKGDAASVDFQINPKVYHKMVALAKAVNPSEVGGLLVCDIQFPKIVIEDILIPEQDCSAGSFFADGEKMADLLEPFVETKPEVWAKAKGWWHSHGNGGTFWSSTDNENIRNLLPDFKTLVSIVTNSFGEIRVRVDTILDNGDILSIDEIDPKIGLFSQEITKWADEQKKKVSDSSYNYYGRGKGRMVYPLDTDMQFPGGDNALADCTSSGGHVDARYGYIPGTLNGLLISYQQMFFNEIKKDMNMGKKARKRLVKTLLKMQENESLKDQNRGIIRREIPDDFDGSQIVWAKDLDEVEK